MGATHASEPARTGDGSAIPRDSLLAVIESNVDGLTADFAAVLALPPEGSNLRLVVSQWSTATGSHVTGPTRSAAPLSKEIVRSRA